MHIPAPQKLLRLVVGGGRAAAFPTLQSGDISLNIARAAQPHILGDITSVPLQPGQWRTVFFERVPFPSFTGNNIDALSEAARVLCPGGRLMIETGSAAPLQEITTRLRVLGFTNIHITGRNFLRITATLGGL